MISETNWSHVLALKVIGAAAAACADWILKTRKKKN